MASSCTSIFFSCVVQLLWQVDKDEDDPQFSLPVSATAQLPRTHTDIVQEVLEKLAQVDEHEDTDCGEIMGSQNLIAEDKGIVDGESASDQAGKCDDLGDNNRHQMSPETLAVPQIVQVSPYEAKRIDPLLL